MNAPDLSYWTLNSCFDVFRTVWVLLGPFHRLTKLGSKWAELVRLMQKFVLRNCVRIFGNERSWSTPLDPKLIFWCILLCLGVFGTVSMPYKTRFKMGRTGGINAKVCGMKSGQNISQRTTRSTPWDSKLMFWCVSYCMGAFGTVSLPYETRFKTSRTCAINAKTRATTSRRNISQWMHSIHPIWP